MSWLPDVDAEWLETDGLGGFAMGTVGGRRTRRYHALLVTAIHPPTGRQVLVNGFDAVIHMDGQEIPLSTQLYAPFCVSPDNSRWLEDFQTDPWPTWTFQLPDGARVTQELLMPRGHSAVLLRWSTSGTPSRARYRLLVRPFLSGRDFHALQRENPAFRFEAQEGDHSWTWSPYPGVASITARANGQFRRDPCWYRNFLYEDERERGLDDLEDLAAPGIFQWTLGDQPAVLIFEATPPAGQPEYPARVNSLCPVGATPLMSANTIVERERARRRTISPARMLAEPYLVDGVRGRTMIAGYPWFSDWGRDTFIALRGLCYATADWSSAAAILDSWAGLVSEGMLPNRFPETSADAEYNSVDASLWYAIAVSEFLQRTTAESRTRFCSPELRQHLLDAVAQIIAGYAAGTRHGIHRDSDGLIAAGEPGTQLTWMDAKVGAWVVTPRIGKPVEIQALWLNILAAFPRLHPQAETWRKQGTHAFREKFWNTSSRCLYDVVDVDHVPGRNDGSVRPNQLFALGGLPLTLVDDERVSQALEVIERELVIPGGLRTLSPQSPAGEYHGRYSGDVMTRDGAYHQGTAWPWLMGPFVEAWLRHRGISPENRQLAQTRYLAPLEKLRRTAGLKHICEILDGDPPHTPRGCPFQAWSIGEYLRLKYDVLADSSISRPDSP